MKKQFLAVLAALSIVLTPSIQAAEPATQTFQDKPALTQQQKNVLEMRLLYIGTAFLGAGVLGLTSIGRRIPSSLRENEPAYRVIIEMQKWLLKLAILGAPISVPVAYVLKKLLRPKFFSDWYRVSYQVANICLYYNINIDQYRTILTAAESRKKDDLIKAINALYPQRFGADWRNRMKALFAQYAAQAPALVQRGSFDKKLSDDERDFVRMIELGAAMANLYYGTQPSRKNAVDSAMKLYKELGIRT